MKRIRLTLTVLLLVSITLPGCRTARVPMSHETAATHPTNEVLHSVLWMQTAVEYRALALQTFRLAGDRVEEALRDPSWTALPELQTNLDLPPAVIVDVDETVLDNTYYEARQIRGGTTFNAVTWKAWVDEANATAVPGALEFAKKAAERGVTVFYVTGRKADEEGPTRRNLIALGFPVDESRDTILVRGERPEWDSSDKGPRRQHVASEFRVLLLVGDDLGDFVSNSRSSIGERDRVFDERQALWGTKWIVLPNPTYGSWVGAILGNRSGLTIDEERRAKYDALESGQ